MLVQDFGVHHSLMCHGIMQEPLRDPNHIVKHPRQCPFRSVPPFKQKQTMHMQHTNCCQPGMPSSYKHMRGSSTDQDTVNCCTRCRHCLWFYFRLSGGVSGQSVLFNIVNFSKARSLYRHGMTPVVRCGHVTPERPNIFCLNCGRISQACARMFRGSHGVM
jgi:hypothetical protein